MSFILEKKSFNCVFRGSTNQSVIDVKASLKKKKPVLIEKYKHIQENSSNRERQVGIFI